VEAVTHKTVGATIFHQPEVKARNADISRLRFGLVA
jgi:hypothetical protein